MSDRPAHLALYAVVGDAIDPLIVRDHPEPAHPYRTPFQRDRARIIHSRAFRRLAGKTQVFTHRSSDHFRSRLTHTMEVAQIARAIASALSLNEDLAEALALVHDIGHPPFGHAGEKALDACLRRHGLAFDHNLHALRIVEFFEQRYAAFRGLNLTLGVREGIVKHSRDYNPARHPELTPYLLDRQPPLEAQLIDLADEIAYLTADFDDGFESGILDRADIRAHVPLFRQYDEIATRRFPAASPHLLLNETLKGMLNALADDLIRQTRENLRTRQVTSLEDIRAASRRLVAFSREMEEQRTVSKRYLYQKLYQSDTLAIAHEEAHKVISTLFDCWTSHPSLLPESCNDDLAADGVPRTVADYIAGMTDSFILQQFKLRSESCL